MTQFGDQFWAPIFICTNFMFYSTKRETGLMLLGSQSHVIFVLISKLTTIHLTFVATSNMEVTLLCFRLVNGMGRRKEVYITSPSTLPVLIIIT